MVPAELTGALGAVSRAFQPGALGTGGTPAVTSPGDDPAPALGTSSGDDEPGEPTA